MSWFNNTPLGDNDLGWRRIDADGKKTDRVIRGQLYFGTPLLNPKRSRFAIKTKHMYLGVMTAAMIVAMPSLNINLSGLENKIGSLFASNQNIQSPAAPTLISPVAVVARPSANRLTNAVAPAPKAWMVMLGKEVEKSNAEAIKSAVAALKTGACQVLEVRGYKDPKGKTTASYRSKSIYSELNRELFPKVPKKAKKTVDDAKPVQQVYEVLDSPNMPNAYAEIRCASTQLAMQ